MTDFNYNRKQLEKLFKDIFGGEINPVSLPLDLFTTIMGTLSEAVARGFGKGTLTDEMATLLEYFDNNVGVFSAAKTHQQVTDMSRALFDPVTGQRRSFESFKERASIIFDQYNVQWLATEYRTALNQGFGARQWMDFEANSDILDLIRYDTAGDERVREVHDELDGIVLPMSHPFWKTHFPPNGWRCRCDATQHSSEDLDVTPESALGSVKPPSELFRMNPALDKFIFDPKHPYISNVADRYQLAKDFNFYMPVPPKPQQNG